MGYSTLSKPYTFYTNCIHADGDSIYEMRTQAVEVSYRTMLARCEGVVDLSVSLGYERRRNQGSGITLKNDWHVGYYKSAYQGKPCYYLTYSGIEYIWTQDQP